MTVGVENNDYSPPTDENAEGAPPSQPLFAPLPLSLTCWPIVDRPLSTIVILIALLVVSFGLSLAASSWLYGLFSAVILASVLWRLWIPVTYRIGANGILQTVAGHDFHVAWRAVGKVRYSQNACVLYRASFASPFTSLQSVVLEYRSKVAQPMTPADVENRLRELVTCYVQASNPSQNS